MLIFSIENIWCVVKSDIQDILNAASYFFLWKMNLKSVLLLLNFSITKKNIKSKQFLFIDVSLHSQVFPYVLDMKAYLLRVHMSVLSLEVILALQHLSIFLYLIDHCGWLVVLMVIMFVTSSLKKNNNLATI